MKYIMNYISKITLTLVLLCCVLSLTACSMLNRKNIKSSRNSSGEEIYYQDEAYVYDGIYTYSVVASKAGEYSIEFLGEESSPIYKVNGLLYNKEMDRIRLNKGINSISLADGENISGIIIKGAGNKPEYGSFVTYTSYEAENGTTTGLINDEDRTYRTFSSEASGRKYVELKNACDKVTITLKEPANALVLRYCIPDSEDGTGLKESLNMYIGEEKQSINITSAYAWVYGDYPWNNNPASGRGHMFFDDIRVKLDKTYPAGTNITFQKDQENKAAYYLIDLIEAEQIDQPLPMPENALSILDYGAIANDEKDDTKAIYDCIKAAVERNMEVFIPEGVFHINDPAYINGIVINDENVTIRGAGMWHTILQGESAAFTIRAGNISFYDFSLLGNVTMRRDTLDPSAFNPEMGIKPLKNLTLQNIWMEHWKVGLWANTTYGIFINGCRIRNTYADGVNLCAGSSNSLAIHNDIRNTGDDGFAMWSKGASDKNNKVLYNTISLPWLANNVALYGGTDIEIKHNWLKDTIYNGGAINISTNFEPEIFEGTITISDNLIERCGTRNDHMGDFVGAIWFNAVKGYDIKASCLIKNNQILDSTYQGISFFNNGVTENVLLENNIIQSSTTYGIEIDRRLRGSITMNNNTITRSRLGDINNKAEDNFKIQKHNNNNNNNKQR